MNGRSKSECTKVRLKQKPKCTYACLLHVELMPLIGLLCVVHLSLLAIDLQVTHVEVTVYLVAVITVSVIVTILTLLITGVAIAGSPFSSHISLSRSHLILFSRLLPPHFFQFRTIIYVIQTNTSLFACFFDEYPHLSRLRVALSKVSVLLPSNVDRALSIARPPSQTAVLFNQVVGYRSLASQSCHVHGCPPIIVDHVYITCALYYFFHLCKATCLDCIQQSASAMPGRKERGGNEG
mmetsp:Transcript_43460/g.113131  ORF Transcript_43460/g.113131 Transcript_43460/m.113131 type:complete len:238 (+) Transcript_43460:234-947(+)